MYNLVVNVIYVAKLSGLLGSLRLTSRDAGLTTPKQHTWCLGWKALRNASLWSLF